MRNIILFLSGFIIICCTELNAQSIKIYHEDIVVSNDSIYINGTTDDFMISCRISVENTTNNLIDVKIRRSELSLSESSVNYFCWGACYTPETSVSPFYVSIPALSLDSVSFFGDYLPNGSIGISVIRYTFFLSDNEEDSVSVTVFYQILSTYAGELHKNNLTPEIFPNPVSDELNIRFPYPNNNILRVNIINLDGKIFKSLIIEPGKSEIIWNIADLVRGYYLLELRYSNSSLFRKRIIVFH